MDIKPPTDPDGEEYNHDESAKIRGLRILAELMAERYTRESEEQPSKHAKTPQDRNNESLS